MNKYIYTLIWFILSSHATYADWWIFGDSLSESEIRDWDIHTEDIPNIIKGIIDFLMWISWTIAVIFVIVWAYKILFGSLEQDKTKWKDTIIMAIIWFAIASLAWFIIKVILDNLWA